MPAKYRKLQPDQLVSLAREIAAAARAVVEKPSQLRAACFGAKTKSRSAYESHQLGHEARELNLAVRAVVDLAATIREELFIAAKDLRKAKRLKRKEAPKCGAYKASGGRCGTRLEPGEFRCPLHAQDLRKRCKARAKVVGSAEGGVPHGTC